MGGRDLDWILLDKFGGEFAAKHGSDPRKNPRCIVRMLEAVEKARKTISSTTDSPINIDYLLEEEDLNTLLSRTDFETLIDPFLRRFTALLKATLDESGK
jgi:molecular chaperone DnaK (HSP70)